MTTLHTVLNTHVPTILEIIKETQLVDELSNIILSPKWVSENRWQLIGEDESIRRMEPLERISKGVSIDDAIKIIIRIDFNATKKNLILSEIFLPKDRTGAGKRIYSLLITLATENKLDTFTVYATNEKSSSLCKKFDMTLTTSTKYYEKNNYYLNIK